MKQIGRFLGILGAFTALIFIINVKSSAAATYTVTSTADSGAGTLREAITNANNNNGHDDIEFNIPGAGPHFITTSSYLPQVSEAVFINGASQPNTVCGGSDMSPQIVINGYSELYLSNSATGSSIRGIAMPDEQVASNTSLQIFASNVSVSCSFFGTADGETIGNKGRVQVYSSAQNVIIGGPNSSDQNVFINNMSNPFHADSGSSGTLQNNLFNVTKNSDELLGNGSSGATMDSTQWSITENVFGGNQNNGGPLLSINSSGAVITKNYFGTNKSLSANLAGTGSNGINAYGTAIGSTNPSDANYFYNLENGVAGYNNSILINEFVNNVRAYQVSNGRPKVQPTISGNDTEVKTFLNNNFNNQDYRIDYYRNPTRLNARDGIDAKNWVDSQVVTKNDGEQEFDFTLQNITSENISVIVTAIDNSADGFGSSYDIATMIPESNLSIEQVTQFPQCFTASQSAEVAFRIKNDGTTTLETFRIDSIDDDNFYNGTSLEVTGGSATTNNLELTYQSGQYYTWTGSIEPGETIDLKISTTRGSSADTYGEWFLRIDSSMNEMYFYDTNTNGNYIDEVVYDCGKNTDLKVDLALPGGGNNCLVTGEQQREYFFTVTNNGPNSIDAFSLYVNQLQNSSVYENITFEASGGTGTTDSLTQSYPGNPYLDWEGQFDAGETIIVKLTADIASNSSSASSFNQVTVYDNSNGQKYYYETSSGNNYREFRDIFCDYATELKLELSPRATSCLAPGEQNRKYLLKVTNDSSNVVEEFDFYSQFNPDAYTLANTTTAGTAQTDSFTSQGSNGGDTFWQWTGTMNPGQTVEIEFTTNISSPSINIDFINDGSATGGFYVEQNGMEEFDDDNNTAFFAELYCDRVSDIASEVTLDEPGLVQGQTATYRLKLTNLGPGTIANNSYGNGALLLAHFPVGLTVTSFTAPTGYSCDEPDSLEGMGVSEGTVLQCFPNGGASPLLPNQSLIFTVQVMAGAVNSNTTVSAIGYTFSDPNFPVMMQYANQGNLFGTPGNSTSRFIGTVAGDGSTGGGGGASGGNNAGGNSNLLSSTSQLYKNELLAKSGENIKRTVIISASLLLISSLGIAFYINQLARKTKTNSRLRK